MPLRKFKDGDFVFSISEEEEKKFCSVWTSPSSLPTIPNLSKHICVLHNDAATKGYIHNKMHHDAVFCTAAICWHCFADCSQGLVMSTNWQEDFEQIIHIARITKIDLDCFSK